MLSQNPFSHRLPDLWFFIIAFHFVILELNVSTKALDDDGNYVGVK